MAIRPRIDTNRNASPACTTGAGRTRLRQPGPDRRRGDDHRQRDRQDRHAGLQRVLAEHELQVERDHEERAGEDQVLARRRSTDRRAAAEPSGGPARAAASGPRRIGGCSQREEQPTRPPAEHQKRHDGEPERRDLRPADRRRVDRLKKPHALDLRMPNTTSPSPSADSIAPTASSRSRSGLADGPGSGGPPAESRARSRSRPRTPPATSALGRDEAADQRPAAAPARRDSAEQPVGLRALLAGVVDGRQRGDRRDHEDRARAPRRTTSRSSAP